MFVEIDLSYLVKICQFLHKISLLEFLVPLWNIDSINMQWLKKFIKKKFSIVSISAITILGFM